jgi:hypothetical protein
MSANTIAVSYCPLVGPVKIWLKRRPWAPCRFQKACARFAFSVASAMLETVQRWAIVMVIVRAPLYDGISKAAAITAFAFLVRLRRIFMIGW